MRIHVQYITYYFNIPRFCLLEMLQNKNALHLTFLRTLQVTETLKEVLD